MPRAGGSLALGPANLGCHPSAHTFCVVASRRALGFSELKLFPCATEMKTLGNKAVERLIAWLHMLGKEPVCLACLFTFTEGAMYKDYIVYSTKHINKSVQDFDAY